MSVKSDLEEVLHAMRGEPSFPRFIKTLTARREFIVNQLVATLDPGIVETLRGEARAYDYIIKAANPRPPEKIS